MKKIVSLIILLAFFPLTAFALEDPALDNELKELHEAYAYITTASKIKENINETVATVTRIDQQQIRDMGARNLLDVLKLVPGFGITQSVQGVRQVEVRGVKTPFSEKVLFLLNGHPFDHNLQNASSVWVYDDLPVDTIKRIEIVRGTGSALYGANAFLAVVNIITQTGKDLDGFHASSGWGSFDTQQYRASWGKQFDNSIEAAVHFNFTDTNGIRSPIAADSLSIKGLPSSAPGKSQLKESRYDLEWQLGYADFKLDGRYINKKTGTFFGAITVLSDSRTKQDYNDYFLRLSRHWKFGENLSLDTQVFHDFFSFDNTWQVAPALFSHNALEDTRTGGEIQANYALSAMQNLMMGVSYAKEVQGNIISELGYDPAHLVPYPAATISKIRHHWGIYVQDVWNPWENLHLTLGGRYDHYNDLGGTFNPRLGFNWEFVKNYSLKFSYGTAYRAPSFAELTSNNNPTLTSNSTLSPETVKTFEGGIIAHPFSDLTLQATYYYTGIDKIISPILLSSAAAPQYKNNGHVITQGIETEVRYNFKGDLQGSYLSANSVWQNGVQQGRRLADIPRYRTNLMANWAIDKTWSSFAHLLIKSSTARNLGDVRANVPGYAIMDLGLVGKNLFGQKIDLGFNIYNLFDKRYYDPAPQNVSFVGDFQAAGIAFFGHVSVGF
jgi:iron complex outermembrane receptor protein